MPPPHTYESEPLIDLSGFREYDVRWRFPEHINLMGLQKFGLALGLFYNKFFPQGSRVVVGHDWRSYSMAVKQALIIGLMNAGCHVVDIGLSLSPMAYFAQQDLAISCLAMVTASHNENGWTGVKMSVKPPLTLLPDDIAELKENTLKLKPSLKGKGGGTYYFEPGVQARYKQDLLTGKKLHHPLRVVVGCGNGTAGLFVPTVLTALGAHVIPRHCDLNADFPHYNPNPEDMKMLADIGACVVKEKADIGLAFDGDGDRCGVIGPDGKEIFSDKIGVLLARYLASRVAEAHFVVDVKSTKLYMDDPLLQRYGARVHYWKTGHSYLKEKMLSLGALAGFEKSGHTFFAPPFGRGYDDGLRTAIMILYLLDEVYPKNINDLYATLKPTWLSPTMSPFCPDEKKYEVVERVITQLQSLQKTGSPILNQPIQDIMLINGIRVTLADGTWGLVRASSNKPSLVIVVESPHSHERMVAMFHYLQALLEQESCVGSYDQVL